mmetsp:Transcript_69081/g.116110  ORF Transcript_69081/g.116110 Transcript_69081/m.116110 type:complete len:238 (-) Transcript_69081:125-838(-)
MLGQFRTSQGPAVPQQSDHVRIQLLHPPVEGLVLRGRDVRSPGPQHTQIGLFHDGQVQLRENCIAFFGAKTQQSLPNDLKRQLPELNFYVNGLATLTVLVELAAEAVHCTLGHADDLVQNLNAEYTGHHQPLLLPQLALTRHEASPQQRQERPICELLVLGVALDVGLPYAFQMCRICNHNHLFVEDVETHDGVVFLPPGGHDVPRGHRCERQCLAEQREAPRGTWDVSQLPHPSAP